MFIEIDKINIKDEKLEDMAVTSICIYDIIPKITKTEYAELNKQIITNLMSLNIKNKTKIIIRVTKKLNIIMSFLTKLITSLAINSTPPR